MTIFSENRSTFYVKLASYMDISKYCTFGYFVSLLQESVDKDFESAFSDALRTFSFKKGESLQMTVDASSDDAVWKFFETVAGLTYLNDPDCEEDMVLGDFVSTVKVRR